MNIESPTLPLFCTVEWFRDIICQKHSILPSETELRITKRDSISGGYLSYITKLHLSWQPEQPQLPTSVLVKVVTLDKLAIELEKSVGKEQSDKTIKTFVLNLENIHNNECYVYETFFNRGDCNVPKPIAYAARKLESGRPHGLLVLQDLSEVAEHRPVQNAVSPGQAKMMVEIIATLQAYGMQNDRWISQLNPVIREAWVDFAESIHKMFESLKSEFPEIYSDIAVSDIEPFTNVDNYMKYCFHGPFEHRVFVHGDLWASNILTMKGDSEFSEDVAAVIDWQLCHGGQPGFDMARFMVIHLSAADRRAHEWELLDHYYDVLSNKLGHSPPFTKQYVKQSYKESMCYAIGFGILSHGLLTHTFTDEENRVVGQRVVQLLKDGIDPNYYGWDGNK